MKEFNPNLATVDELIALRLRLLHNGYDPIPISVPNFVDQRCGKQSFFKDWWFEPLSPDPAQRIRHLARAVPGHQNTGLACGTLVAVNGNIGLSDVSKHVGRLAQEWLGLTPLYRLGRPNHWVRCYRVGQPYKWTGVPLLTLGHHSAVVDVLGEGRHIMAYGLHPGLWPYHWVGRGPDEVPLNEVPVVTAEALDGFLHAANAALQGAGWRDLAAEQLKDHRLRFGAGLRRMPVTTELWLRHRCARGPEHLSAFTELFADWCAFTEARDKAPGTAKAFSQALKKLGFEALKHLPDRNKERGFRGLSLRPDRQV